MRLWGWCREGPGECGGTRKSTSPRWLPSKQTASHRRLRDRHREAQTEPGHRQASGLLRGLGLRLPQPCRLRGDHRGHSRQPSRRMLPATYLPPEPARTLLEPEGPQRAQQVTAPAMGLGTLAQQAMGWVTGDAGLVALWGDAPGRQLFT